MDGKKTPIFLDNGCQVNVVTPEFVLERDLPLGPLSRLMPEQKNLLLNGLAGHLTRPLGFTMIRLQFPAIKAFNELSIALVIPDTSDFGRKVPVTVGTCSSHRALNLMTESEMDSLTAEWATVNLHKMLLCRRAIQSATQEVEAGEVEPPLNELVRAKHAEVIPAFGTRIVVGTLDYVFTKKDLHVMTHGLDGRAKDLPTGLAVQDAYITPEAGTQRIHVVIRNQTAADLHILKRSPIAVAEAVDLEEPLKAEDVNLPEDEFPQTKETPLTPEQRRDKLLETIDLSGLEAWDNSQRADARSLLREYHDIFSLDPGEIGKTDLTEHKIHLTDEVPFKERFRKIPQPLVEEVRTCLRDMLEKGVIRPSKSAWSNAVVLVRKKDGGLRFCVDFRRLNVRTKRDSYPLPRIVEVLDCLTGAAHFSSADLTSGFWQIGMEESSIPYTAFTVGNLGFFECLRMPFGLCNAPATFQRLMQRALGELEMTMCMVYLDDVVIFSSTPEEHLARMRIVFQRFRDHGLKLKPSKCNFFRSEITYLAHHISKEGVRPSPDNVRALAEIPPPDTYTGIREFLGAVGHYRRFIKGFSKIAGPLNSYISGPGAKLHGEALKLSDEAIEAFNILKRCCMTAPVLAFADYSKPFLLEIDASGKGLGAVISQKQKDLKYHPVAFASRTLNIHERNYHSSKLEFLALKWSAVDHFKSYLIYLPFLVRTDNNPLTYVLVTPHLDATGLRWTAMLADLTFALEYIKGKNNVVPDALSRVTVRLTEEEVKAVLDGALVGLPDRTQVHEPEMIGLCKQSEERVLARFAKVQVEVEDWNAVQREDPLIKATINWLEDRKSSNIRSFVEGDIDEDDLREFEKNRKLFFLKDNLLYKSGSKTADYEHITQFVVPKSKRVEAMNGCHRDACHQGVERSTSLVRERFWWPRMILQMEKMVKACRRCQLFEAKPCIAPLHPIEVTAPHELLHIDFTTIETTLNTNVPPKIVNVLVMVDHYTRHVVAYVTPDQKAKTVAKFVNDGYFNLFGAPEKILSDRGKNFVSQLVQDICKLKGVQKLQTTAYHAMGNGQAERMHQTIFRMIGKLSEDDKEDWPEYLGEIVHAYNCTRSAISGYSPYFLMFGLRPRLPVDLIFPTSLDVPKREVIDKRVATLREKMRLIYKDASQQTQLECDRQKRYYDKKTLSSRLEPGDSVAIRTGSVQGKRKICDRWSSKVWKVVRQIATGIPAYVVRDDRGRTQTVHRNRLLILHPVEGVGVPLTPVARKGIHELTSLFLKNLSSDDEEEIELPSNVDEDCQTMARKGSLGWFQSLWTLLPWTTADSSECNCG